ncbi:MAG: hypothetical protein U0271_41440 [Polyangiaceae bacterium]
MKNVSFSLASAAALSLGIALAAPSQAHATEPCEANTPCHNNFAEPIIMFTTSTEAFAIGTSAMIGNAASLARPKATPPAWLALGYVGSIYNVALGLTWTSLAGQSLSEFPDDDYALMQLGVGLAHLALGTVDVALTAAGQARRSELNADRSMFSIAPAVAPVPGGGSLVLAGTF